MLITFRAFLAQLLLQVELAIFDLRFVFGIPEQKIVDHIQQRPAFPARLHETDDRHKILPPENFIQQAPHQVQVLVVDLHEDGA